MKDFIYRIWVWVGDRYGFTMPITTSAFTREALQILQKNLVMDSSSKYGRGR